MTSNTTYHVIPTAPMKSDFHREPPYWEQPQNHTVIVVTEQPRELSLLTLPHVPVRLVCPTCKKNVATTVNYRTSCKTHLCALWLCLFVCWPCCLFPYCSKSCRNADHHCTSCGSYIATAI